VDQNRLKIRLRRYNLFLWSINSTGPIRLTTQKHHLFMKKQLNICLVLVKNTRRIDIINEFARYNNHEHALISSG